MGQSRLFFWDARGLYIGPAFGLRPHRNAVAVLCVALDAPARLARNPLDEDDGHVGFRTALVPPNTLHHLRVPDGQRMAFLYVDALSEDYVRLLAAMRTREARFALGHRDERRWIDALLALADGAPWREARYALSVLLGLAPAPSRDPRIVDALLRLQSSPAECHGLAQAASHACLSPSRFLHLFKAETGVPFRRYRLWIRMGAALKAMRSGATLTEAAHTAGFSSSGHFSDAFSGMFGMPPSRLSRFDTLAPAVTGAMTTALAR
jgi:AraC-like DNA-binding protein